MPDRHIYLPIIAVSVVTAAAGSLLWAVLPPAAASWGLPVAFGVTAFWGALASVAVLNRRHADARLCRADECELLAAKLQRANATLDQRVLERTAELAELNKELGKAKEEAEAASRSKSIFLSNMSHEIRTPMNAVLGLTHLALQTELTEKQRDYLNKIHGGAQSLLEIINDVLDFSKIEAGRLQLEKIPFSLEAVIERSTALLGFRAREKGLTLTLQVDPDVPDSLIGDPLRLEQVLVNLLGNAIKFTESGSIEIRVARSSGTAEGREVGLCFSVTDTGIGMDQELQSRIFSPFLQGDNSTTRTHGGTGLGLSICRSLVEMMGGTISVVSSPGQGSRFSFTVMFGAGTSQSHAERSCGRQDLTGRYQALSGLTILVAEDHPVNRLIVKETLEAVGIRVLLAENGRETVEQALEHGDELDLVLMDIQMPVMDGFEACREIRKRYDQGRLPVVAMTAHVMRNEREQCLDAGMNEHLPKPVAVEQLYAMIAAISGRTAEGTQGGRPGVRNAVPPQEAFPQHLPGIRLEAVRSRVNGNVRLLGQLVRMFAREHGGTTAELVRLIESGELLAAARLLHGLKGVAGNLAAERLHQAALDLETALRDKDVPRARGLLVPFEEALDEVCSGAALLKEPQTADCSSAGELPAAQVALLLAGLQQLLETHSLAAGDRLEQLAGMLSVEDRVLVAGMTEAVQKLEYEKALVLVHELAGRYAAQAEESP